MTVGGRAISRQRLQHQLTEGRDQAPFKTSRRTRFAGRPISQQRLQHQLTEGRDQAPLRTCTACSLRGTHDLTAEAPAPADRGVGPSPLLNLHGATSSRDAQSHGRGSSTS
ncbi:hypothetical protein NDU88_005377 [Pleurodeles waltl]|uniref:Uncharacterized protein n=1 Tax=Pleurodeles waltl TaxID=8319 RepID=A0AAV7VLL2_PLEWA|nr:hypothetical protein NDU88_005377 [Pleurodeles waltl]